MKKRIRVGDRVLITESQRWPHGAEGTVIRKDAIISGKRIISYWFIVQQDGRDDPRLLTRSDIEFLP